MALDRLGSNAIADGVVATADIADGSISTAKLANDAVTTAKVADTVNLGRRNIIINGDFKIAQRATSVSSTDGTNEDYSTVDRWFFRYGNNAPGTMTISQDTDVPSGYGFAKSWKFDVTATGTATGDNHTLFSQFIEAQNLRNSGWDYTNPSSYVTLSFWVKSTKTGTYCVTFDATDVGGNFKFIKEYTIDSASTWEKKTISIPGHASLVFDNNEDRGCELGWNFASGENRDNATDNTWHTSDASRVTANQVNFLDDTANDYWITGVQLEVGDTATPFEHRSYAEELFACQRYYEVIHWGTYMRTPVNLGQNYQSRKWIAPLPFKVEKRVVPTSSNVTFTIDGGDGTHAFQPYASKSLLGFTSTTTSPSIGDSDVAYDPQQTIYGDAEL